MWTVPPVIALLETIEIHVKMSMRLRMLTQVLESALMALMMKITDPGNYTASHVIHPAKHVTVMEVQLEQAVMILTQLPQIQGLVYEIRDFMTQMMVQRSHAKADFKIEQHVRTTRNPPAIHANINMQQSPLHRELVHELLATMITPRVRLHWTDSSVPMNAQHVTLARIRHEQAEQMLTLNLQVVPVSECVPTDFTTVKTVYPQ